jgi:hypothetical protein
MVNSELETMFFGPTVRRNCDSNNAAVVQVFGKEIAELCVRTEVVQHDEACEVKNPLPSTLSKLLTLPSGDLASGGNEIAE